MIINWNKYNQDLVTRGRIDLNISKGLIINNRHTTRGREYKEDFITSILMLRQILRLQLRQTQGFITSLVSLMNIKDTNIPHYSTISRSYKKVDIKVENYYDKTLLKFRDITTIVDSTGITIIRKGEWLSYKEEIENENKNSHKTSIYKKSKSKFIKLHLMIDKDTGIVLSNSITESYGENTSDTSQYPVLIDKAELYHNQINNVLADKAYDSESNYKVTNTIGSIFTCPVKDNVKNIDNYCNNRQFNKRYKDIDYKYWSEKTGYNYRCLIESYNSSYKRIYGSRCRSKKFENIKKEIELNIYLYNQIRLREIDEFSTKYDLKIPSKEKQEYVMVG
jgi:hypothetical protein